MATDLTFLMKLQNEMSSELKRIQGDMKELDGTTDKVAGGLAKAGESAKDKAAKGFKEAGDEAHRSTGLLKGLASGLGDVAKLASGIVIGGGLLQLPGILKGLVGGASDMNESLSKVSTVFGPESASSVERWAEAMAKMGVSKSDALAAAGTFGNFFATVGVNKEEAAGMSESLVQLASDFASFHNASPTEVMEAMGAALRGEAEPMSKYGILMNDATLKAQALKMGLISSEKEGLTPQTKALAANALMFQQAGAAYGDFDRTSDGLANRQRVMSAEFENMKDKIGTALLPGVLALGEAFMGAMPTIEKFGGLIVDGISKGIPAIQGLAEYIPKIKAGFAEVAPVLATIGSAVQSGIQAAIPYIQQFAQEAQNQFARFRGYYESDLKPAFDNIKQGVQNTVAYFKDNWGLIAPVVSAVVDIVKTQLTSMWDIISGIVKIIVDLIGGDWSGAWEHVKELARNMVEGIISQIGNIEALVRALFPLIKQVLSDLGGEMLKGIKAGLDHWDEVRDAIWEGAKKLPGLLGNVTDWLVDVGWDILRGIAKGIYAGGEAIVKSAIDWVSGLIPGWAKGPLGISSPSKVMHDQVGLPIADGIAKGILAGIPGIMLAASYAGAAAVAGAQAGAGIGTQPGIVAGVPVPNYKPTNVQSPNPKLIPVGNGVYWDPDKKDFVSFGEDLGGGASWDGTNLYTTPGGYGNAEKVYTDGRGNWYWTIDDSLAWSASGGATSTAGYNAVHGRNDILEPARRAALGLPAMQYPLGNNDFTVANREKGEAEYRKSTLEAGMAHNGGMWGSHAPSLWMEDFLYQNQQMSENDINAQSLFGGFGGLSGWTPYAKGKGAFWAQQLGLDISGAHGVKTVSASATMDGQPIQVILQIDGRTLAQIVTTAQKDMLGRA